MRPIGPVFPVGTLALALAACSPAKEANTPDPAPGLDDTDHAWESDDVTESICDQAPAQAQLTLQTHCYRCHGESGSVEGGFNYVLDVPRMKETGMVVPTDPDLSRILVRMESDTMPPSGEVPRPGAEDVIWIEDWIKCGAEDFNIDAPRSFISQEEIISRMASDVNSLDDGDQPFTRYISLVHLYNQGVGEDALDTYRNGVAKLLNSLSWSRDIAVPQPIDTNALIYRFDLRDYAWEPSIEDPVEGWEHVLKAYPYGFVSHRTDALSYTPQAVQLRARTQSRIPYIFADWLVQAAAVPPLYHDILRIPDNSTDFLALFGVDRDLDIAELDVVRAGFDGTSSGVSNNNRMIERHDSETGYCWISYDFAEEEDESKNIFLSPLDFSADGGELFCTLPNGLQAYMLEDGNGDRLDVGPRDIVEDPESETGEVINGLSCMRCHYEGVIPKNDQIRSHVESNESLFSSSERPLIYQMYVTQDVMRANQDLDRARFLTAMDSTGTPQGATEPISALSEKWQEALGIDAVASEMGLDAEGLRPYLDTLPDDLAFLSVLNTDGMTIKRSLYVDGAADLLCHIEFGEDCAEESACGPSGVGCLDSQICILDGPNEGACIASDEEPADQPEDESVPEPEPTDISECSDLELGSSIGSPVAFGDTRLESEDWRPTCVGVSGPDLALLWRAPQEGCYRFDTNGSDYDTTLAIYGEDDGVCAGDGTGEIACDDDSGSGLTSQIELLLLSGSQHLIIVDGYTTSSAGGYQLNITEIDCD